MSNIFKTTLLLTAMTLLLMLAGRAFGGQNGMLMALVFAAIMNFVSYFFSDKIALATYRAQPVSRDDLPRVYNIVERLAQKVGLPMPKVYVIPSDSPNAFATGRNPNHASVAVTQGILGLLNDDELEGVLAHELGHVRNRDILISSIAATLAGAITWLASIAKWGMIFGGMRGETRRSRRRRRHRSHCHDLPRPLRSHADSARRLALARIRSRRHRSPLDRQSLRPGQRPGKIEAYSRRVPLVASPSTAHLFIIQPFLGGMSFGNLFSTHPPTAKRIERLTGRPAEFMSSEHVGTDASSVRPVERSSTVTG